VFITQFYDRHSEEIVVAAAAAVTSYCYSG